MIDMFMQPLGIGFVHPSAWFVAFVVGLMLTGAGLVAAHNASRGSRPRVWKFVYGGVLVYSFLLFFSSLLDGLFIHPVFEMSIFTPLGLAGLLAGVIVLSRSRHVWDARREEEERRMFVQDL